MSTTVYASPLTRVIHDVRAHQELVHVLEHSCIVAVHVRAGELKVIEPIGTDRIAVVVEGTARASADGEEHLLETGSVIAVHGRTRLTVETADEHPVALMMVVAGPTPSMHDLHDPNPNGATS